VSCYDQSSTKHCCSGVRRWTGFLRNPHIAWLPSSPWSDSSGTVAACGNDAGRSRTALSSVPSATVTIRGSQQASIAWCNTTKCHFEGNVWEVGNTVPIVSVLKRIMDGIANHFPAKSALDCRILHIQLQSQIFSSVTLNRKAPGVWTKRISAWLASVPTDPIFRNDH